MEVMRQGVYFRVILTISVAAGLTMMMGCSGSKVRTKSSNELSRYHIRSIVLIPFTSMATPQARDQDDLYLPTPDSIRRSDISLAIPRDIQPPPRQTMMVPGYAAEKVTELFWGRLQDRRGVRVLPPGEAVRVSSVDDELAKMGQEKAAAAVATRLKADAALFGRVLVYQERVGSRLGANPPATVGFEAKVVAADGQLLWVGGYYERQRPMNEDLMGFLQRWAFVTAEELAEYGVDEVLKDFPFGAEEGK
jgi:hypothetical protein